MSGQETSESAASKPDGVNPDDLARAAEAQAGGAPLDAHDVATAAKTAYSAAAEFWSEFEQAARNDPTGKMTFAQAVKQGAQDDIDAMSGKSLPEGHTAFIPPAATIGEEGGILARLAVRLLGKFFKTTEAAPENVPGASKATTENITKAAPPTVPDAADTPSGSAHAPSAEPSSTSAEIIPLRPTPVTAADASSGSVQSPSAETSSTGAEIIPLRPPPAEEPDALPGSIHNPFAEPSSTDAEIIELPPRSPTDAALSAGDEGPHSIIRVEHYPHEGVVIHWTPDSPGYIDGYEVTKFESEHNSVLGDVKFYDNPGGLLKDTGAGRLIRVESFEGGRTIKYYSPESPGHIDDYEVTKLESGHSIYGDYKVYDNPRGLKDTGGAGLLKRVERYANGRTVEHYPGGGREDGVPYIFTQRATQSLDIPRRPDSGATIYMNPKGLKGPNSATMIEHRLDGTIVEQRTDQPIRDGYFWANKIVRHPEGKTTYYNPRGVEGLGSATFITRYPDGTIEVGNEE